jgi:hypothetical protein
MKQILFLLFFNLFCCVALAHPKHIHGQELLFEDDFSQGFIKWKPTRDNGSMWSIVDGKAYVNVQRFFYITEMIPKDQYWNSNWHNIEYELDFTPLEGVDRNVSFGFQDVQNWYEIHFVSTEYNLVRLENGIVKLNVFSPFIMENGRTYRLKIQLYEGNIKIFTDGVKIADQNDWSFNQNYGRIGIKAGTGSIAPTRAYIDNVIVRSYVPDDGKQLHVELLKQFDPKWKDQEYDSATKWSDRPTIHRWGCALTSMAMILRYHGLKTLPDGTVLDPASLNSWLRSQSDGYLHEGSLNWIAVTRLTRLISEKINTPKLEFKRLGADLNLAKNEINGNRPVILQLPGHFLVADGVPADQSTLSIKDPAYTYTKLNQHHDSLLSFSQFVPSHTDLSYMVISHSPGLHITLKDESGTIIPGFEEFSDQIKDVLENSGETNPALTIHHFPKPNSGKYTVEAYQNQVGTYALQFLTYDSGANVTQQNSSGTVGLSPIYFEISYQKNGVSQINQISTFAQFRQDLKIMKAARQFPYEYGITQIDELAKLAQQSALSRQLRYLTNIQALLKQYKSKQTTFSFTFLNESLNNLLTLLKKG